MRRAVGDDTGVGGAVPREPRLEVAAKRFDGPVGDGDGERRGASRSTSEPSLVSRVIEVLSGPESRVEAPVACDSKPRAFDPVRPEEAVTTRRPDPPWLEAKTIPAL